MVIVENMATSIAFLICFMMFDVSMRIALLEPFQSYPLKCLPYCLGVLPGH